MALIGIGAGWGGAVLHSKAELSTTAAWVMAAFFALLAVTFFCTGVALIIQRVRVVIDHRVGKVTFHRTVRWSAPKEAVVHLRDLRALASHRLRRVSSSDVEDWTFEDLCVGELKDGRLVKFCVDCPAMEKDLDTALRRLKGMPPAEDWVEPS